MKLRIEIDLDNAAFDHQPGTEIANLLERLAGRFWGAALKDLDSPPHNIFDNNGNTVGWVVVTE